MEKIVDKRIVLFISMMGAFLVPFMSSSVVIALPSIGNELSASTILLNWILLTFLLSAAIFVVPFGRIADIFGRKKIYLYGLVLFTFASILCAISISSGMLLFSRVLQGISGAMIFSTSVAILTSAYPPGERGKVLGLNVAVTYLGLSLGPVLGGVLTHNFGWRSIFLFTVPFGVIAIYFIITKLKFEWTEAKGEGFDYFGSIIYGIALFCIMTGLSLVKEEWFAPLLIIIGIIALFLFGFYESRLKYPVLNISLFKGNKVLVFSSLAALINYSATYAVGYLLSLYLQFIKGFTSQEAGLILLIQPAIQAAFSPVSGKVSDKIEPQKVASIGMAISALGLLLFIFLDQNANLVLVVVGLVLLGFGFALFSSPNTNAIMSSVEKRFYGVTSGILGAVRLVGQTFSIGITSLIFIIYFGGAQITRKFHPHFIQSSQTVFIILTLLSFAGIFASLSRGKLR